MKAEQLRIGTKVQMDNGATAEVLEINLGDHSVLVRYVDSPFEPTQVGTEARCSEDEITGAYEGNDLGHTTGRLA